MCSAPCWRSVHSSALTLAVSASVLRMPACTHFCQRDLEAQTTLALRRLNLSLPGSLPASCLRPHAAAPNSLSVALVVRGESFRHFPRPSARSSYEVPAGLRRRLLCSPSTHALQAALAANHVANLIEPLERRGTRVEVFLATYGCWGVLAAADAERWHADLRSWYGGGARVAHAQPVARDASTTQADLLSAALAPVLRRGATAFGAVLLWRFDLVAPAPIAGASATPADYLHRAYTTVAQVGYDQPNPNPDPDPGANPSPNPNPNANPNFGAGGLRPGLVAALTPAPLLQRDRRSRRAAPLLGVGGQRTPGDRLQCSPRVCWRGRRERGRRSRAGRPWRRQQGGVYLYANGRRLGAAGHRMRRRRRQSERYEARARRRAIASCC